MECSNSFLSSSNLISSIITADARKIISSNWQPKTQIMKMSLRLAAIVGQPMAMMDLIRQHRDHTRPYSLSGSHKTILGFEI